jgi:hypothetical protein
MFNVTDNGVRIAIAVSLVTESADSRSVAAFRSASALYRGNDRTTMPDNTMMMATTTMSSIRVKPLLVLAFG